MLRCPEQDDGKHQNKFYDKLKFDEWYDCTYKN